ncbi:MAG: hypothetical protein DF168_01222 [Candidatus Moanabacter tarae]|uniref:Uncharacterized protein n=1 Tax=Candidatus Moanibacter tarae TaxID=2200854 RepID=A0A2Z4ACX2_9BACT|nr:MAG: hypothetical protein DF168_01222 [Candidatus Moanabacter tarae]|tara:strand:+ start:13980 stop:14516 length:537 start_codon:yes stop_codon:yes gene_type:complete
MNRLFKIAFVVILGTLCLGVKSHAHQKPSDPPIHDHQIFDYPDPLMEALESRIRNYHSTQQELQSELRKELDNLDNPTDTEIRAVKEKFRANHADVIEQQRAFARRLRHVFLRTRSGPIPALRNLHKQLHLLPEGEKKALLEQFKEKHGREHRKLKKLRRKLHDAIHDANERSDKVAD